MVAGILIGLVAVLVAMYERGGFRRSVPEDAAPGRAVAGQRAPSATQPAPVPRPALPQAASTNAASTSAAPEVRPSARAENRLVLTQIKVQKYVEEAYPAWVRAHPGQDCPHELIELNEYMEDKDANDAWGRPLKMRCGASPASGAKGIKVISYGRDAQRSEDDIVFGE